MTPPTISVVISHSGIVHRAGYERGQTLYGCSNMPLPSGTPTETLLSEEGVDPVWDMPTKGVQASLDARGLRLCKLCFRGPKQP